MLGSDNFTDESARGNSCESGPVAGRQLAGGRQSSVRQRSPFPIRTSPGQSDAQLRRRVLRNTGDRKYWAVAPFSTRPEPKITRNSWTPRRSYAATTSSGSAASIQHVSLDARLANRFAGISVFPTLNAFTSGTPDMFVQAFGDPHTQYGTNPVASWIQDQWRPVAGMTVVAGVRYRAQKLPGSIWHGHAQCCSAARHRVATAWPRRLGVPRRCRLVL